MNTLKTKKDYNLTGDVRVTEKQKRIVPYSLKVALNLYGTANCLNNINTIRSSPGA